MKLTFCTAVVIVVIAASPALAETLTCSTTFQGHRARTAPPPPSGGGGA